MILLNSKKRLLNSIIILTSGIIIFILGLGNTGLVDETPPLFAAAARAMSESGDWLTPKVNGIYRFDKPPLIYWLMGFLSNEELQKELGKCRGLLNTPKWNEAYGNVIVEALACGVPVVAYKRGGPSEIIQHGQTGYLADPDDKKNMLSYVVIIDKIKRQKYREWVEKNASSDIFANKVVKWLNKLMQEYK